MPGLPLNATAKGRLVDPLARATCNRPTAAVLAARIFLTTFRIDDDPTHHTVGHPYFPPVHAADVRKRRSGPTVTLLAAKGRGAPRTRRGGRPARPS
jgi:hypothetical protein